jgi:hypothetical protein
VLKQIHPYILEEVRKCNDNALMDHMQLFFKMSSPEAKGIMIRVTNETMPQVFEHVIR